MRGLFCVLSLIIRVSSGADLPLQEGEEIFLVGVHSSLISELLRKPIFESSPFFQVKDRVVVTGTSTTTGTVVLKPVVHPSALAIQLSLPSFTSLPMVNTTDGVRNDGSKSHPEIGVQFGTAMSAHAQTYQTLLFQEQGLVLGSPQTSAQASLHAVQSFRVQAQGLLPGRRMESTGGRPYRVESPEQMLTIPGRGIFPRLRARLAFPEAVNTTNQKLAQEKATAEKTMVDTLTTKLNESFSKLSHEILTPLHQKYFTFVYQPFIERDLLGGHLGMGSDSNWFVIRASRGKNHYTVDPTKSMTSSLSKDLIQFRMHPEFIERLALQLAGTEMNEIEVAELMGEAQPDDETLENVLGNPEHEVLFEFDEIKPIDLVFKNNTIRLTLRMSTATTLGQTFKKIQLSRVIQILPGTYSSIWLRSNPPEVPVYQDGTNLPLAISKHIQHRFTRLLKTEPFQITNQVVFDQLKPLQVGSLRSEDNRLTLGLKPVLGSVR